MSAPTSPSRPTPASSTRLLAAGAAIAIALGVGGVTLARRGHGGRGLLGLLTQGAGDLHGARAARHPFVAVGAVANNSGVGGDEMRTAAESGIQDALSSSTDVTTTQGGASNQRSAHAVARGHQLDANIQSIRPGNNSVRIQVSIVVSSYPGREYEFESASAITITGGSATSPAAQADGVRTAMRSATQSAITQMLAGVP